MEKVLILKSLSAGETLIELISAFINKTPLPESEDWNAVFEYAKKHSLGSLFFLALKDGKNLDTVDGLREKARHHYSTQTAQQVSQEFFAHKLYDALNKKQIKFAPIKGEKIRALYPAPMLRTSCDVDVFYDGKREKEVKKIMADFGFTCTGKSMNHLKFQDKVVTFEMHHALAAGNGKYDKYYKNVWNKLVPEGDYKFGFNKEDFYIYFMVHAAKHFAGGGFGVRTVLDVYFYVGKQNLDGEYLSAEFKKIGLDKFVKSIEKLALSWFGDRALDEESKVLSDYILSGSTYGKAENRAALQGVKSSKSKFGAKIAYLLKTLFPSFRSMKALYPILKPLPFLLPFMWVFKWFHVLFFRPQKFRHTVKNVKAIDVNKVNETVKIREITGIED